MNNNSCPPNHSFEFRRRCTSRIATQSSYEKKRKKLKQQQKQQYSVIDFTDFTVMQIEPNPSRNVMHLTVDDI